MTPLQVCLFKQFIATKGMESMFISLYRKYHLKANPLNIEDFFRTADPTNVCMTAFYFVINRRYGYDYWQRMQNEWMDYLAANEQKYIDEGRDWTDLKGIYKELRLNWNAPKHWAYEKREVAAKRLNITLPEDKERLIAKAEEEALHQEAQEKLERETTDFSSVPEYAVENNIEPKNDNNVDDVDFEDEFDKFNIIDLKPRSHNSSKLKDDEISLNQRNKKSSITFNLAVSREIQERGGYEYAAIANESVGVVLVLNDVKGVPMLDGRASKKGQDSNACINSKVLCARIEALLNITDDYTILKIREYRRNNNYVAYIVSPK